KGVVDEHRVAPLGKHIGPSSPAIIILLMFLHERMLIIADADDLARAEVLVSPVIVQPEDGGEPSGGLHRLEKKRLGRGTIRELPVAVLDREPVVLEGML